MRKLPIPPNAESGEHPTNDKCPITATNQSTKQLKANDTEETSTHCVDISSHSDSVGRHSPLIHSTDDGLDAGNRAVSSSQSTDATAAGVGPTDLASHAFSQVEQYQQYSGGRLDDGQLSTSLIGRSAVPRSL